MEGTPAAQNPAGGGDYGEAQRGVAYPGRVFDECIEYPKQVKRIGEERKGHALFQGFHPLAGAREHRGEAGEHRKE